MWSSGPRHSKAGWLLIAIALFLVGSTAGGEPTISKLELASSPDPNSPALKVVSLDATGADSQVSKLVFLRQTGADLLQGVKLRTDLEDPQVTIQASETSQSEVDLPAAGGSAVLVTLKVTGTGSQPTTHGKLLAQVGDRWQEVAKLKVQNRLTKPSVEFGTPPTVSATLGWPLGSKDVHVHLSVRETAGQELSFTNLALVDFTREWRTQELQAGYEKVLFLHGSQATNANSSCVLETGNSSSTRSDRLNLQPNQTSCFGITVHGLDIPGKYEGTVRLSGPNLEPVDSRVVITLRYCWGLAALLIGLGVGAGHFLSWWSEVARKQLVAQRAVAYLLEEVQREVNDRGGLTGLTSDENTMVEGFRRRLETLYTRVRHGEDIGPETEIIELKFPVLWQWIDLRRLVPAGREDLLASLAGVATWLLSSGGTEADRKKEETVLGEVRAATLPAGLQQSEEASDKPKIESSDELWAREVRSERMVTGVLMLVAIASGLVTLYIPSPAWGSSQDLLVALLWGLGLHSVGGSAFGGIAGLRARFEPQ